MEIWVQVRRRSREDMICLPAPGIKRPHDSSCRCWRPDSAYVGSRPSFFPWKTLLPCQNWHFRLRTLMWAASSRAKWKAEGWGDKGGINGPALLPHPCRSYSKWPHWCRCRAFCWGAPAEPKPGSGTQRSLDTCQQTGQIDWDLAQLLLRLTRCFYLSLSIRPGMSREEERHRSGTLLIAPPNLKYFIFHLCQINFHLLFPSIRLFPSTLLIFFWLQLLMCGAII